MRRTTAGFGRQKRTGHMDVTFSKLRSGDWGVRGPGEPPAPGSKLAVVKRDGSTSAVTVDRVVWSGHDARTDGPVWLAAIVATPRRAARGGGRYGGGRYWEDEFEDDCVATFPRGFRRA
jgi:hypothetical protein